MIASASTVPHCQGPWRLDVASESECQKRKARYVCPHGFDVWRVLSEPEPIAPPVKGSHDTRLPDLPCAKCGAPARKASVYCAGCAGTEAACQWCRVSEASGHGACVRHGGVGSVARKAARFQEILKRKRRLKLTQHPGKWLSKEWLASRTLTGIPGSRA